MNYIWVWVSGYLLGTEVLHQQSPLWAHEGQLTEQGPWSTVHRLQAAQQVEGKLFQVPQLVSASSWLLGMSERDSVMTSLGE